MKDLNKHKNMLFNPSKKSIYQRDLNNIKKINTESYDESRSDNHIIYIKYNSSYSSISSLRNRYKEKTPNREINNLDQIVSTNIKNNQVNDIVKNELKFDSINSPANNTVNYPLPIVTIRLRGGKKYTQNLNSVLTFLWDSGATDRMIKFKHIDTYNSKLRDNKVKCIMDAGPYKTTNAVKITFSMPEFSRSKIITHQFNIDYGKGDSRIVYDMIIGCDLMLQLDQKAKFWNQILEWGEAVIHMKEPRNLLGQLDLTKRDMRELVMQLAEKYFTREATYRVVKILVSTYENANIDEVAAASVQLDKNQRANLLSLLIKFDDFFDGTLGKWKNNTVNLEVKPVSKPFNARYYLVNNINKETFHKEIQ